MTAISLLPLVPEVPPSREWSPVKKRRKLNELNYITIEEMEVDNPNWSDEISDSEKMVVDDENDEGRGMEVSVVPSRIKRRRKIFYYYSLKLWNSSRKRKWSN